MLTPNNERATMKPVIDPHLAHKLTPEVLEAANKLKPFTDEDKRKGELVAAYLKQHPHLTPNNERATMKPVIDPHLAHKLTPEVLEAANKSKPFTDEDKRKGELVQSQLRRQQQQAHSNEGGVVANQLQVLRNRINKYIGQRRDTRL